MNFHKGPDLRPLHPDVPEDHAVLTQVLHMIEDENFQQRRGWALEFGVATGTTLAMIAQVLPVIGFDSFNGLPEDWRPNFPAGKFAGVRPPADIPNSTLVEGLFSETLPGYDWPDHVALIHIDCDLYSSTIEVLTEVSKRIEPGTYIVFDEFFGYSGAEQHEQRAWDEFISNTGLEYSVVGHGREQWAVKITGWGK